MKRSRVKKRSALKTVLSLFGTSSAVMFSTGAVAAALSLVYATLNMPDSLVASWLVRPLAVASLATVGSSGGLSTVGASTSVTTPAPVALKPMRIGVNLNSATYYSPDRIFMNLAADSGWVVTPAAGGSTDGYFDANRNVVKVLTGDSVHRPILVPTGVYQHKSVDVVCHWDGSGTLQFLYGPTVKNFQQSSNSARYTQIPDSTVIWTGNSGPWLSVYLKAVDATNPVRNFDCREANADRTALFDPTYLANVKRFSTVRFMKWSHVEANQTVTWATRTTPAMGQIQGAADGYPIEYMIALANQAHVNPWFNISWNADDDYIRRFAQLVHDTLDPTLTAYIETSNEVWNWNYAVTTQAHNEGLAEGLTTDGQVAIWYRYAERVGQQMDIWKSVFTDNPSRIVRLLAGQHGWPASVQHEVSFGDTATKVDAIATAPYFEFNLATYTGSTTDFSSIFASMKTVLDSRMDNAATLKQLADQYHLRYVTYEGGQHMIGASDAQLLYNIQHDPGMGQLYKYFLQRWNNEIGDETVLFDDVDNTSQFGAWGMLDFMGQAPNATPKSKAVLLMQQSLGQK